MAGVWSTFSSKLLIIFLIFIVKFQTIFGIDHSVLKGHQIWLVKGEENVILERLKYLEINHDLDLLDSNGRIRVTKENENEIKNYLIKHNLNWEIIVHDLQQHLKEHDARESVYSRKKGNVCTSKSCPTIIKDAYMTVKQIRFYLKELNQTYYPRIQVSSIGKTEVGLDIWMVHFKARKSNTLKTKSIWIEAGLHAREWISISTTLYLIEKLKLKRKKYQNLEIFVVPLGNPEGYKYTHSTDRLWRKNRNANYDSSCPGVDLNRNWNYKFGIGASSEYCSIVYKGPSAFSEKETIALSDEMTKIYNLQLVLAVHSYGQLVYYPWGWTTNEAPDTPLMIEVANIFTEAVKAINNRDYTVINSASGYYYTGGTTDDWAKAILNVPCSYTVELPNLKSHVLPARNIIPIGKETWAGFKALFKYYNKL